MPFLYENRQIVTPGDVLAEGDYHLRFVFCEPEELESDICEEAVQFNWKILSQKHDIRKKRISSQWLRNMEKLEEISGVSCLYYK